MITAEAKTDDLWQCVALSYGEINECETEDKCFHLLGTIKSRYQGEKDPDYKLFLQGIMERLMNVRLAIIKGEPIGETPTWVRFMNQLKAR